MVEEWVGWVMGREIVCLGGGDVVKGRKGREEDKHGILRPSALLKIEIK